VCVDLGGGEAFVSEEFLNDAEVGSGVEHVCCEGVSECVWGDFGSSGEFLAYVFFDDALDAAGGEWSSSMVYECAGVVWFSEVGAYGEVLANGLECVGAELCDAFFVAFSEDADGGSDRVDVFEGECCEF